MYEFAVAIAEDRQRTAHDARVVNSIPRKQTWSIGRYRLTLARSAHP